MTKIITSGRTDIEDYFRQVVLAYKILSHTPLLAFIQDNDCVRVEIIDRASQCLHLPDETPMMGQWHGQWHSDFFQFTVSQLKNYVLNHPENVYYDKEKWLR